MPFNRILQKPQLGKIHLVQRGIPFPASSTHDLRHAVFLRLVQHHFAARLDNPRFFKGNLFHSTAQLFHMVQSNVADHCSFRRTNDIGGIQPAAHAHLQHYNVTMLPTEIQERNCSHQLKLCGPVFHGLRGKAHLFRDFPQLLAGNHRSVDAHTLVEHLQKGRNIQPRTISGTLEHGGQHGGSAPLAVGAGNVDKTQILFGVAQLFQQLPRPLQTQPDPLPGNVFNIGNSFLTGHEMTSFRKKRYRYCMPLTRHMQEEYCTKNKDAHKLFSDSV